MNFLNINYIVHLVWLFITNHMPEYCPNRILHLFNITVIVSYCFLIIVLDLIDDFVCTFFCLFHLILSYQINSYLLDYAFVSRNQNPLNVANTCSCDDNITAFKSFFKSISNFIKCSYDPVLKKLSIFQIAFFEELKKYFTCSLWFQTTQWRFMVYIANRTMFFWPFSIFF